MPANENAAERRRMIEDLMAMPVKAQPAVTIFGDDSVTGFNPPPLEAKRG